MRKSSYFNFDLILERVGEKYRTRVFDSPAGQVSANFDIPFSELELENFVLRMGRPRTGVRRVDSVEMEAVKQCGERLFQAVFADDVYACFLRSRDMALEQEKGLRVRLHIDVPEFHDYPWEFLYNAHLNQFLALSKDTPVVRYLELPYPVQPLTVQPPLKILVMISSPEGFPKLNVEDEWRRLSNALTPLIRRDLVKLERLKNPTLSALQQHLRRGEYHIFHFVGHGKFSEHKQDGMLLLENENGHGRPVSGQYLGTVLHDHHSLRLVVLNACEGARTSQDDPYAGVAQTLVLQGIPAVIAMQFEILETAAITFAQEFYGAVADGFPVDAAVSEARKAIFARGNDVEWGTPVLYMRTPQGVIFEIPEALRARQPATDETVPYVDKEFEQKLEGLYTEGLAAFWVEDWNKACDRFQKILADRPDHVAAADKLAEAKRQLRLSVLYAQASEAQSAENWTLAFTTLEELLKDIPDYKNAATMLKEVKRQKQLAELYAEAKQLHAAQKWQAVAKVFAQIKSIEPEYSDPENLLFTAEKELEELKRQAELKELYGRAVREIDGGHWDEAQKLLRQTQEKEPGFLETERLLSKVEMEIRQSEEEQKRQYQINMLHEQAHGLLRSKKWRQALDKIEAIRKLDEQFEDTEKIAEQARAELAREEQETEHQNELAAMYAETVRLLSEEKFQEALEKWQGIKSIDSKYPDRQKIQRTARKGLAALAKPVSAKRKVAIPKSFWIGLGGIVTIAVVILAWNLIGNNGERPSSPAISSPVSGASKNIVVPTSTKIPEKINTQQQSEAISINCMGAQPGDEISMIYQWSGFDEDQFHQILQPLLEKCGIVLSPVSTRDLLALLGERIRAGVPPDIAFGASIGYLHEYKDKLFAMDALSADPGAYIPGVIDPAVIDGRWVGLPVKSSIKTTIWYSPTNFNNLGYRVPTTWNELEVLVEQMANDSYPPVPWSMGLESGSVTGWTGSDFIQDILLVQQGPEYVMGIINGSIPYNDVGVKQAYEIYGKWARDPRYTVGGAEGTISGGFMDAIYILFSDPPEAMMVKQADWVGGAIAAQYPDMKFGTNYNFFIVPGTQGLQGNSDWMMAFSDKPAVQALVRYLSSPEGGANWAKADFGLSPNRGAAGNYNDPILQKEAEAFYTTRGFTSDIGDTISDDFNNAEWTAIVDYLNGGDLDTLLSRVAAVQEKTLK